MRDCPTEKECNGVALTYFDKAAVSLGFVPFHCLIYDAITKFLCASTWIFVSIIGIFTAISVLMDWLDTEETVGDGVHANGGTSLGYLRLGHGTDSWYNYVQASCGLITSVHCDL